jgi:hypothetical protein
MNALHGGGGIGGGLDGIGGGCGGVGVTGGEGGFRGLKNVIPPWAVLQLAVSGILESVGLDLLRMKIRVGVCAQTPSQPSPSGVSGRE